MRVCEGTLGRWESSFAKEVFYPYSADEKSSIRYGNWMLKFCTSVSWRVLKHAFEENGLKSWADTERLEAGRALDRWHGVIMGKYDHPGPYEQHLLPLGAIAEKSSRKPPPDNINRYFMRGIEMDIARGGGCSFTFAKMGRFALFGFLQPSRVRWSGSRVPVKTGEIRPREFTLPIELRDYLYARAQKHADIIDSVPDHQVGKIEEAALERVRKGGGRDQLKAMSADAEMFGRDALLRK